MPNHRLVRPAASFGWTVKAAAAQPQRYTHRRPAKRLLTGAYTHVIHTSGGCAMTRVQILLDMKEVKALLLKLPEVVAELAR